MQPGQLIRLEDDGCAPGMRSVSRAGGPVHTWSHFAARADGRFVLPAKGGSVVVRMCDTYETGSVELT